jgi:hypothetical protein
LIGKVSRCPLAEAIITDSYKNTKGVRRFVKEHSDPN